MHRELRFRSVTLSFTAHSQQYCVNLKNVPILQEKLETNEKQRTK